MEQAPRSTERISSFWKLLSFRSFWLCCCYVNVRDWLGRTCPKWDILYRLGRKI